MKMTTRALQPVSGQWFRNRNQQNYKHEKREATLEPFGPCGFATHLGSCGSADHPAALESKHCAACATSQRESPKKKKLRRFAGKQHRAA
jgi:hypothetical protein